MAQKMHRQQNTDNSTETQAQTSLCHTICICYISVTSTVLHPFSHPLLHSQAVWGSVMPRAPHNDTMVFSSKPSYNATSIPSRRQAILQPYRFFSCSYSPPFSCKALKHVQLSSCVDTCHLRQNLILFSKSLSKLFHQLSLDLWDHVGVSPFGGPGSAGSHRPQAAVIQAGSLGSIFSERS